MKTEKRVEKIIATNKKAFHDFHILDTYEAGMSLRGTEVKSLRQGNCSLRESYARIEGGEMFLYDMHIAPYEQGTYANHDPRRKRKLLLHKWQIERVSGNVQEKGLALVPTKVYFSGGRAKVEIGVARGKQVHDKRRTIAERDMKREVDRQMREREKGGR